MAWLSLLLGPLVFAAGVLWIYRAGLRNGWEEASCQALDEPEKSRCLRRVAAGQPARDDKFWP